jgi:hypothetical protein
MEITRTDAIHNLIPNTEWHLINDTLTVFTKDANAPTMSEIDAKVLELQEQAEQAKIAKATDKAALLSKLGITADEAKLLLS